MNDPNASQIARRLAGSVLSQAKFGKQTGEDMQSVASRVLRSSKYSVETKSLAASVLSQSTTDR